MGPRLQVSCRQAFEGGRGTFLLIFKSRRLGSIHRRRLCLLLLLHRLLLRQRGMLLLQQKASSMMET